MEVPQRKSLVPFPEDARLPGPVAGPLSAVLKERPSRPVAAARGRSRGVESALSAFRWSGTSQHKRAHGLGRPAGYKQATDIRRKSD